ncbi:LysR substrate-binding domain-containing protein [Leucobacter massiliensis]|uniref:LysR family transcriptional regulator n=1 Tax=Leucobacter massiliensis TaxID=1686285 RepID=A0A2S9QN27_9MICO|nr:LysR substrate-binding domain-containing protein [Leucobacter massiliensis]PRI10992.1 LysR family transcriptional regulator [Leucobacter massiliensis]
MPEKPADPTGPAREAAPARTAPRAPETARREAAQPPTLPAFTLRQLAYFAAAADAGTIAAAAARLRVSPSAMSDAITELEAVTGERLCLRRRAHGLSLTPAGERLVAHARRMLAEAEELSRAVGGDGRLTGPVVIGCYPTLAPTILPPLLQGFAELHPGIELSIREATQDRLVAELGTGRVDVAVVYDMLVPGEAARTRLYELRAYAVLAAGHRLASRPSVRLEDLVDEELILLDAPPSGEHTLSLFAEQGLAPRIRHRTASYEVVRTLVARGLGYGILVSPVANPASYEGLPLASIPISPAVRPVAVDMVWAPDRPLPARSRALIDFARRVDWPS